jgi:hypothetical protein
LVKSAQAEVVILALLGKSNDSPNLYVSELENVLLMLQRIMMHSCHLRYLINKWLQADTSSITLSKNRLKIFILFFYAADQKPFLTALAIA